MLWPTELCRHALPEQQNEFYQNKSGLSTVFFCGRTAVPEGQKRAPTALFRASEKETAAENGAAGYTILLRRGGEWRTRTVDLPRVRRTL